MAYSGIKRAEYNYSNLRSDDELRSDFQARRESDKIEQAQREGVIQSKIEARRTEAEAHKALEEERKARQDAIKEQQRLKAISEQGMRQFEADVAAGASPSEALRKNAAKIYIGNVTSMAAATKEPDKIVQVPFTSNGLTIPVNSNTVTGAISPIRVPTTPTQYETITKKYTGTPAVEGRNASSGFLGIGAKPAIEAAPEIPATTITQRIPIGSNSIPAPSSTDQNPQGVQSSSIPVIISESDYINLPIGSEYLDSNGNKRRKNK